MCDCVRVSVQHGGRGASKDACAQGPPYPIIRPWRHFTSSTGYAPDGHVGITQQSLRYHIKMYYHQIGSRVLGTYCYKRSSSSTIGF